MTTSSVRISGAIRSLMSVLRELSCCFGFALLCSLFTLFASLFLLSCFATVARADVVTIDSVSWRMGVSSYGRPNWTDMSGVSLVSIDRVGGSYVGSVNTGGVGPGADLWPIHVNDDSTRITWGPSPACVSSFHGTGFVSAGFASDNTVIGPNTKFALTYPQYVFEFFWQDDKVNQTQATFKMQSVALGITLHVYVRQTPVSRTEEVHPYESIKTTFLKEITINPHFTRIKHPIETLIIYRRSGVSFNTTSRGEIRPKK